jgi:uncharacterized protein (DUF2062 family)
MGWLRRRLLDPLAALLQQGLSPEGLALSLVVGLALGIIPLWGTSTALCVGAAAAFRLNQVAMQAANYLAYPLQLALLIPFIRLGERLFGTPRLPISLPMLQAALKTDPWGTLGAFWTSLWHATLAWLLVVPLPGLLLVGLLIPAIRLARRPFRRP